MSEKIDVAMPTYNGENVVRKTLDKLHNAIASSPYEINRLVVDYCPNNDSTDREIRSWADEMGVPADIKEAEHSLPEAREYLIGEIETDWFLFLDDDVRLRSCTLSAMHNCISPATGGVQVKKARQNDPNHKWSKWRPVRGTTFATLLRTDAVDGITIPDDCTVLEDEFIRQYVESEKDYLWTFNFQAVVDHDNQGRHTIDTKEGYLAGKYGLLPYDYIFLNVPYNVVTFNHPIRHFKRALGYCYGLTQR